jgi:hypothetical protein
MKAKVKEIQVPIINNMRYGIPQGMTYAGTAYVNLNEPEGYIDEVILVCPICDTELIKSIMNNIKLYCPKCRIHDIEYD